MPWAAIAERLGATKGSVNSSYRNAKTKQDRQPTPRGNLVEVKKPKETAEALDMMTEPWAVLAAAAKECGFPPGTIKALMKRMQTRYKPLDTALREYKKADMIRLLESKAFQCAEHIDEFLMGTASIRDLAITLGVLTDKTLLLKGEPTSIMRTDMRKLDELMPALVAEAKRRGVTIDVTPEEVDAESS